MSDVERIGHGPPLVLIHGSPGNAQSWKGVVARLKHRFTIIAPTLPGHGEDRDAPAEPTETAIIAADIAAAIGPVAGPLVLAGHSYGGNVALHLALAGHLPLRRVVLFEPVAFNVLSASGLDADYAVARAVFDKYVARVRSGDLQAVGTMVDYLFGAGAFQRMPAAMRDYLTGRASVNARDVAATFRERYSADALHGLAVPIAIAHGGASPRFARLIAEAIAQAVPSGRTVAIEGATHAMLATDAAAVAELIAAGD